MPSDAQWKKCGIAKIENFTFTEKQDVNKYYPQYYHKTDKDGRPIYIECLGKVNVDALKKVTNEERLLNHLVLAYEEFITKRLPACTKLSGHPVTTCCTILDLKGISTTLSLSDKMYLLNYIRKARAVSDLGYPGCTGKFYIIHATKAFEGIWTAIKPLLSDAMVDKIHIVSEERVKEELLSQIPAENLPVEFGGKCQCPGGCSSSDAGPWKHQ